MLRFFPVAIAVCAVTATASAQDAPSFTESFFLLPTGSEAEVADMCARSFGRPLTNSGAFIERSSSEVSEVITTCVADELSSNFARECDLAIAQSEVDYVIFTEAAQVEGAWVFEVAIQSPSMNAGIWSSDAVAVGDTPALLAREHCAALSETFLASRRSAEVPATIPVVEEPEEAAPVAEVPLASEIPEAPVEEPEPEVEIAPTSVRISLSDGAHRFHVSLTDSQGRNHECRRRVTNNRTCELGGELNLAQEVRSFGNVLTGPSNLASSPLLNSPDTVLSGPGMLEFHTGRHSQLETVALTSPATQINIQHINQDRRGARIAGFAALGLGFIGTIASIKGITDPSPSTGQWLFFGTSVTTMAVGEGLIGWGFLGRHNYEVETYTW